jgi:UDP-2,4-diacetamido-2,4,6-trideoxy-beta-L-altropyranose hydrolase
LKVAVRADASSRIGSGHVVRCLTLAQALSGAGAQVRFLTRPHDLQVSGRIRASGFAVAELPPAVDRPRIADGDYSAWLGVPEQLDAEQSLAAIGGEDVDLLIVDHYGLGAAWEARLAQACGAILVVDDLANRAHAADVLVDQNLRADGADAYGPLVPDSCRVLSGPSYALIREEYVRARRSGPGTGSVSRVLISFGGVDDLALLGVVLDGLSELADQLEMVELVVADPAEVRAELGRRSAALPLRLHGPQPHLAGLMAHADLAIGAGGGTTWERLCVGLPSIVVSRADNQRRGTRELARLGAIIDLGDAAELTGTAVRDAVHGLLAADQQRWQMQQLGQALVDGRGRGRVVESVMPTPASALTIREAGPQDRGLVWMWANDRTVREQSLDRSPIPFETHVAWFDRVGLDPDSHLLIMEADGLPVGQLRFDLEDGHATVNYSLDACVRGRGWGRRIIEMGLQWLSAHGPDRPVQLVAIVRVDNPASSRVFERLGFVGEASSAQGSQVRRYTRMLEL